MRKSKLDDESQRRIWDHRQALSSDFYQISNFFLLGQSFLFTSAVVTDRAVPPHFIVICAGLAISVVWIYIQAKQKAVLDAVKAKCVKEFPEYADTRAGRSARFPISNTTLMAIVLPGIFVISWVLLVVFG